MKRVLFTAIVILILSACSSGVSQEQFNQLLEQNQQLIEQNQQLMEQKQKQDLIVISKHANKKSTCKTWGFVYPCGKITYFVEGVGEKDWIFGDIDNSDCFQEVVIGEPLPVSCRK